MQIHNIIEIIVVVAEAVMNTILGDMIDSNFPFSAKLCLFLEADKRIQAFDTRTVQIQNIIEIIVVGACFLAPIIVFPEDYE